MLSQESRAVEEVCCFSCNGKVFANVIIFMATWDMCGYAVTKISL